ncbi:MULTISPECIES: VWA domain-containing protein [Parafrankia]|uniref:VWFA domain-containing protein n=1 Tax=Parafrankia soli TaxID=2599596 RepID=A0A1S1PPX3_9ACTN|nr:MULTISPECIES: VWA domain-containing protein [Parafrankia]OHV23760.1 hypothetical protein BBK14_24025 [Parafrankia soli]TCJ34482.1 VWA domain-containing protein [Parafrankia sp. BMG5.11]CAI7978301.1 von Willebrand factor type A [Frankia sp. Hr75.2]SQD98734.1 von Willebrand factor type A [Parafrankia sp. Ea1.12]
MSAFTAKVYQNEFLPVGGTQVHAVITVTSTGAPAAPPIAGRPTGRPEQAMVILLDCSGSMANPPAKVTQARRAVRAALDSLPDGAWFAVVRGTGSAAMAYPRSPELVPASAATRAAACHAVDALEPHGGTAMGRWLRLANDLLATRPDAIGHALLLTDGQNGEMESELLGAVDACQGRFQCDCRGVGTDWRVEELRAIATGLLGTVDAVPEPAGLAAEFERIVATALDRATDRVSLRLWTPTGASLDFLREVTPDLRDLTGSGRAVDDHCTDYQTGAWGIESRDYHLCVRLPAREVGTEVLAARVSLVVDHQPTSSALVRALWTDDTALATRVNTEVAHYTGQAELARVLADGLEARQQGDDVTATLRLGRGVQIALASGNEATYRLLQKVVHIDDPTTGTVRLKKNVEKMDEMVLDSRSTRTVRVNR